MRGGNRYRRLYSGITYDPAAVVLFAAMTTQPTQARKALIDQTIRAIKSAGVWPKLDYLQVYAAADSQAARLNWINPATNTASAVSSPTFTADRGYTADGVASYVETNFNPSTATNYAQNSAMFGIGSRTANQLANSAAGWFDGTDGVTIQPRGGLDATSWRANAASAVAGTTNTDGTGIYLAVRTGASATQFYKNGAAFGTGTEASTAVNNATFSVGRVTAASFAARQFSLSLAGGGLTSGESAALSAALQSYLTAVGA